MAATFDKGNRWRRWERHLESPQAALKQIGILMLAETQQAFRDQRLGDKEWPPRGGGFGQYAVNLFGIISDFYTRSEPLPRRFDRRPALIDTGRLRASFSHASGDGIFRTGPSYVEVGTTVPYANVHQTGGKTESLPVTESVQRKLAKWLKGQNVALRRSLGWVLNRKFKGKTLEMEVPERPMIGITSQTIEDVGRMVGVHIFEERR